MEDYKKCKLSNTGAPFAIFISCSSDAPTTRLARVFLTLRCSVSVVEVSMVRVPNPLGHRRFHSTAYCNTCDTEVCFSIEESFL